MPLSLSARWKTSFSTTCKALCVCLALLAAHAVGARAEMPSARTLLVYDARNPAMARQDVERFSTMMTAMGKSLDFGDIRDYRDALAAYEYVVCYRMEEIAADELDAICEYEGHLMIMGSDLMRRYLMKTGRRERILMQSELDRGVLRYGFSSEASFETIVQAENIARFEAEEESAGTIAVGVQQVPFFSQIAGVRFTPVTSLAPELVQAAMMQELTKWMWPYQDAPPDYGQYLVLDSVYPFMDAQALLEQVDALIDEGIPYVLSVMPIYKNTSYPAMVQFCQVLRYAQQNGGFIILHAPIVQAVGRDEEELYQVLTDGLKAYTDNGVYPLGIEVPVSWTNDDFYLNVLGRYRTVFVRDTGEESGFTLDAGHNSLYDNAHQLVMPSIALDETRASYVTCYPSAIYLDAFGTDAQEIRQLVGMLKRQRVPFQNLWELEHAVWANDLDLRYEGKRLYLSGEAVDRTFTPVEYDEAYDYNRNIINRITVSIQSQNRWLTAATVIIVAVFALLMIYLRRVNRRSFFS